MFRTPSTPAWKKKRPHCHLYVEELEPRNLLSAASLTDVVAQNFHNVVALYGPGQSPGGYWPGQIRHAYGFDQLSLDGTGQTIAIVDAYHDPNLANDLDTFDKQFTATVNGTTNTLYNLYGPSSGFLKQVSQSGGSASNVPTDSTGGWEVEEALDVEWAHAIAPKANILLVEANSAYLSDLLAAVSYAASQPNVVAVSMSWGGNEFAGQSSYDSYFTTPTGHQGVTFVAASGDNGTPAGWPASSPNVLAVGGTSLSLGSSDTRTSESGWSSSGGGYSGVYGTPSYQLTYAQNSFVQNTLNNTVLLAGSRGNPDVSYAADSSPGFAVYDSFPYYGTAYTWFSVGGTSAGSPQWAALIALADQQRGASGSLDGPSQTLPNLYKLAASSTTYSRDFYDVTSGFNGYSAQTGYDLVTGLGSPQANNLIPDLAGTAAASSVYFTVSAPSSATAGSPFGLTVTAHNSDGSTDTGYTGTVHFTSSDTRAGVVLPANSTLTNGTGTFNVTLVTAGTQTLTATDTANSSITATASVTVSPAAAYKLVFGQQPTSTIASATISPAVTVRVLDQYNNLVTNDSDQVSLALGANPGNGTLGGTTTVTASGGVATFSNLSINQPGTGYTLVASSPSNAALLSATSAAFNITSSSSSIFRSKDTPAPILGGYITVSYLPIYQHITIKNLTVQLNVTYPYDGDLAIEVRSPRGTWVDLSDFEGGTGANFSNTIFSDNALTPIYAGTPPFSGSYQPETALSAMAGQDAYGTWKLAVWDFGYSTGTLNSWSVSIQPNAATRSRLPADTLQLGDGGTGPSLIPIFPASAQPGGMPSLAAAPASVPLDPALVSAVFQLAGNGSLPGMAGPVGPSLVALPVATPIPQAATLYPNLLGWRTLDTGAGRTDGKLEGMTAVDGMEQADDSFFRDTGGNDQGQSPAAAPAESADSAVHDAQSPEGTDTEN